MHEYFPYRNVRQGNAVTKRVFTAQCKCGFTRDWESTKPMPVEVVRKKFQDLGWAIGKKRRDDLCPKCVGVTPVNRLTRLGKVTANGATVPSPAELADAAASGRRAAQLKTAALIDRVFGPAEPATPDPLPPEAPMDTPAPSAHPEILAEIGNLRAAIDLLVESNSQLIKAVAGIVPALVRSNEVLGDRIVAAIEAIPQTPPVVINEPALDREVAVQALKTVLGEVADKPAVIGEVKETALGSEAVDTLDTEEPVTVTVASSPYPNGVSFNTTLRFDRAAFERLGFSVDDRFRIVRDGQVVLVQTDPKGVRIKSVNSCSVMLQTSRLGPLDVLFGTRTLVGTMRHGQLQLHPMASMEKAA